MNEIEDLALGLWQVGAIKFGSFTLKSGVQSPFYINLRLLIADPGLLRNAARAMSETTDGLKFDCVAGLPYGGLPPAVLISQELDVPLIFPRREIKTYGDIRAIEGNFAPGQTALVVDDLITDGQSKLEAVAILENAGLKVEDMVVLVDRQQGGVGVLAEKGYNLRSVVTITELLSVLRTHELISTAEYERSIEFVLGV